jgi:CRP-like cAMP-binding protein
MSTFEIFEGLTKREVECIFDLGVIIPIDGEEVLFQKGEVGHEMFVILTGKVEIIDEYETKRDVIAELSCGDIFGEMAIFQKDHMRSTHAVVKGPSQLLVLSEDIMGILLDKKIPKRFLVNIIRRFSDRLRLTNGMYMLAKHEYDGLFKISKSAV